MTLAHESLELTRTDGQRLVVYMAAPGTGDYDAMVLLDMTGFAAATPEGSSHDSGVSPTVGQAATILGVSLPKMSVCPDKLEHRSQYDQPALRPRGR